MYIPTYIDIPMLLFSFMVGYETYRTDYVAQSVVTKKFMLMAVSVVLAGAAAVINRNETALSLPLFLGSVICVIWAVYLLFTRPAKLPTPPSLD